MNAFFNKIVFIDAFSDSSNHSSKNLYDDIEGYTKCISNSPTVEYNPVKNSAELIRIINKAKQQCVEQNNIVPMLHIESHGDETGLGMPEENNITWKELAQPLIELNIATRLNLIIALSACSGGWMAQIASSQRAPFGIFIGPERDMSCGDLYSLYDNFYRILITTKSPEQAIQHLKGQGLLLTTAREIFNSVAQKLTSDDGITENYTGYKSKAQQSGKAIKSKEEYKKFTENQIDKNRKKFFMCDIFPENEKRFLT